MKKDEGMDVLGVEWNRVKEPFIYIYKEKCIGCGYCVNICLGRCYKIENKKAKIISLDKCLECSACWYICPVNAIDFNYPPGGKGFKTNYG
ncbi:MAG: 4Fe-4S dicluster domain-containing protein [Promethearchaeota archaeon]|nr:MAG: 4Fe-4S dicluster domain-containing protein [Candidatus Lokiarchaeota archaeon]